SVTGRLKAIRVMGKVSFADLEDGTGTIQILVRRDSLAEGWYNEVWKRMIDLGDFVGATGTLTVTRTGEVSVSAESIQFLSKTLRPMPDKWHGVKDQEKRYRRRYVDLIANAEVRDIFRTRSAILRAIREYLDGADFLEVETPILQPVYGGAAARPFVTHHNQLHQDLYLRISFELYLKRLIVGGFEKVYEINRNFRNEGISTRHNPEFTMLELYTAWWDYRDTMDLVEEMLRQTAREVLGEAKFVFMDRELDFQAPFQRKRLLDLLRETFRLPGSLHLAWGDEGAEAAHAILETVPDDARRSILAGCATTSDDLLIALFEECVEANLWQPTIVYDWPKSKCPLSKGKEGDAHTAERFELYVGGMELANAYSELNDPDEQRRNFEDQVKRRQGGDEEATMMDEDYVRALEHGMPPASGLGVGIDRLVMLLTGSASIRDVILFPLMRPGRAVERDEDEDSDTEQS
ncbi:lysine--tRNA ligase, partial [bacterium]|nr:lysine--tRNA ligase [bacterium]